MPAAPKNEIKLTSLTSLIPPLGAYHAVISALEAHIDDELARMVIKRLQKSTERHKKELGTVVRDLEGAEINSARTPPRVYDLKGLQKRLRASASALENLLKPDLDDKTLKEAKSRHKSVDDFAGALIEMAAKVDDPALPALVNRVKSDVKALKTGRERVDSGGHAGFDPAVSRKITLLWADLDMGFDVLGIMLRNKGITQDGIYAMRATFKSPLRRVLSTKEPGAPAHARGGRPKKNKDGSKPGKPGKKPAEPAKNATPAPAAAQE